MLMGNSIENRPGLGRRRLSWSRGLGLAVLTSFCSTPAFPSPEQTGSEELIGYRFSEAGVEFIVQTGGCTEKEDFALTATAEPSVQTPAGTGDGPGPIIWLHLQRLEADLCRGFFPGGTSIHYSFEELRELIGTELTGVGGYRIENLFRPTLLPEGMIDGR